MVRFLYASQSTFFGHEMSSARCREVLTGLSQIIHMDLIVIATHGMTGWHRLAFGSVAEKVVRLAPGPVLVLRAEAAGKSASSKETSAATAAG